MSVLMTMRVKGDGSKVEELAAKGDAAFGQALEKAERHGLRFHRFFAHEGEVMVVDEWASEKDFQEFFAEAEPEVRHIMEVAGVTGEPEITFWHKLRTNDDVG